jgi:hypothetical protein
MQTRTMAGCYEQGNVLIVCNVAFIVCVAFVALSNPQKLALTSPTGGGR